MVFLLAFSFLSGLVTILAPCIWPLLPIILSSSIAQAGKLRPLGITLGIVFSFAVFTLTISSFVRLFHIDPNILRLTATVVISFLGLTMIFPQLSSLVEIFAGRLTKFLNLKPEKNRGFGGGFITGIALGIVWSPCAGPILATIATFAALGEVTLNVVLITLAYTLGVGLPLFLFSYGGQKIIARTRFVSQYTGSIQKIFGLIMIISALAIYTNYDVYFQSKLLNLFPQFNAAINSFEDDKNVRKQLDIMKGKSSIIDTMGLFNAKTKAPDFAGAAKWFNTDTPLSISDLKGKVVLVDFWTYTCINCIRTLPHIVSWYEKYKNQGFTVIGVHTPEFAFEHDANNVSNAIKTYGIHYPVFQDNDYKTWDSYNNQYWPAEYLIDKDGMVRRTHFGEGEYQDMETAIQLLLTEAGQKVVGTIDTVPHQTPTGQLSPETYLGAKRMEFYYPDGNIRMGKNNFTLADDLSQNSFSLGGEWDITDENAISGENASLNYEFYADKVFLVIRPGAAGNGAKIKVFLDGKKLEAINAGTDAIDSTVQVGSDRLYNLIDLKGNASTHLLHLEFVSPGIEIYAFTFG